MDTVYSENVLAIGRKLVTKLYNAAKFANLHLEKLTTTPKSVKDSIANKTIFAQIDLWVLARLYKVIKKSEAA